MKLRDALSALAAAAALVLVWAYAGLPFPGRYAAILLTDPSEQTAEIFPPPIKKEKKEPRTYWPGRIDTWTGEVVVQQLGPPLSTFKYDENGLEKTFWDDRQSPSKPGKIIILRGRGEFVEELQTMGAEPKGAASPPVKAP